MFPRGSNYSSIISVWALSRVISPPSHVGSFDGKVRTAKPWTLKTFQADYFPRQQAACEFSPAMALQIDELRRLPYKPRQLSAMARLAGTACFGRHSVLGPVSGQTVCSRLASFAGRPSFQTNAGRNRQLCQRSMTREADLSTQQTGAQAPSWLSRPPGDHRRPQGSGRTPCPGSEAPERLSRASRRSKWIG